MKRRSSPSPPPSTAVAVVEINQLATRGLLIKLAGFVGRHRATVLVDCGATGNFVSSTFVEKHGLSVTDSCETIKGYDGRSEKSGGTLGAARVRIAAYSEPMDLTVATLSGYDVILGMPWFERYNPIVDWRGKSLTFVDQHNNRLVLQRAATAPALWQPTRRTPVLLAFRARTQSHLCQEGGGAASSRIAGVCVLGVARIRRAHRHDSSSEFVRVVLQSSSSNCWSNRMQHSFYGSERCLQPWPSSQLSGVVCGHPVRTHRERGVRSSSCPRSLPGCIPRGVAGRSSSKAGGGSSYRTRPWVVAPQSSDHPA